jgi:abhydrolase domain-containing protein 5
LEERLHELQVPVTFIYGDHDWMDPKAASRAIEAIQSHQPQREHGAPSDLRVLYTPNAGHYPFIDQPGVFLKQILETCGHLIPSHAISKVESAAKRHPYQPAPAAGDTKADLDEEMRTNPAAAEAHVATDM